VLPGSSTQATSPSTLMRWDFTCPTDSRLRGVQISAGRLAEYLPSGARERLKYTMNSLSRWKKAVKLHQRYPQYVWRRAMLHQSIRPLAEYGLSLTSWTLELRADVLRHDRHAAEFVLDHTTRMATDRIQAIFRLQSAEYRRRWLATAFGIRLRRNLI
jgi:hypothetical protein